MCERENERISVALIEIKMPKKSIILVKAIKIIGIINRFSCKQSLGWGICWEMHWCDCPKCAQNVWESKALIREKREPKTKHNFGSIRELLQMQI